MRTKIIAGNLAAVLLVGLVSYAWVHSSVEAALRDEVDSRITSDFRLLERSFRLSAYELASLTDDQASQPAMSQTFLSALDETSRRTRAYESADRTASWLSDPARRGAAPDIVAVMDEQGHVVARNADRNRMYQQDLGREIPAVRRALAEGATATGVWQKADENKVLLVAVSPIRGDGRVLGAVLVGYDISNQLAQTESDLLGREVAFVIADRIYSSSLAEGAESEALRGYLFGAGQAATTAALAGPGTGTTSPQFAVTLASDEHVGVVGPAPIGADSTTAVAMVVLADRTQQAAKASSISVILILTVIGMLVVLVYGFLIATSFLRPVEQMEEGILAVINGRNDLRLDIESAEFGGLAYRFNQLLNVLTGTAEEDESGRVSQPPGAAAWSDDSLAEGGSAPAAASSGGGGGEGAAEAEDPELAARLAAEPEDAYYGRVYAEYVAAKQSIGEDVSSITQDKFVQRLKANEAGLVKKHGCRMVRFQVQTRGTQVNLKPVVIR